MISSSQSLLCSATSQSAHCGMVCLCICFVLFSPGCGQPVITAGAWGHRRSQAAGPVNFCPMPFLPEAMAAAKGRPWVFTFFFERRKKRVSDVLSTHGTCLSLRTLLFALFQHGVECWGLRAGTQSLLEDASWLGRLCCPTHWAGARGEWALPFFLFLILGCPGEVPVS